MIGIIDYGLGNVKAFATVFKNLNIPAITAKEPKDLKKINKIILPGVGSFDYAMQRLENSGLRKILDEYVLSQHIPVLGVCVGMQMLAHSSEEGKLPGLGWINGVVKRFDSTRLCVPHMGWNTVKVLKPNELFKGLDNNARFYFLHSYYFECKKGENIITATDYYGEFTSSANEENVYGVQFHPEKSHEWGAKLLKNFAKL